VSICNWKSLSLIVSTILLLAAGVKAVSFTLITAAEGPLSAPLVLYSVIAFEAGLAIYLLLGDRYLSWLLTLITFCVFGLVSGYSIWSGRDCNCFAELLEPRWIFAIDLTVLALVVGVGLLEDLRFQRITAVPIGISLLGGFCAVLITIGVDRAIHLSNPRLMLTASSLANQPWPIDSRVHPALEPLSRGRWTIVVLRHQCTHCRQFVSTYFSDPKAHQDQERTAVFIAGSNGWRFQLDYISINIPEPRRIRWKTGQPFVVSPSVFILRDGVVVAGCDGEELDEFMQTAYSAR